jgi:hypothetical protein
LDRPGGSWWVARAPPRLPPSPARRGAFGVVSAGAGGVAPSGFAAGGSPPRGLGSVVAPPPGRVYASPPCASGGGNARLWCCACGCCLPRSPVSVVPPPCRAACARRSGAPPPRPRVLPCLFRAAAAPRRGRFTVCQIVNSDFCAHGVGAADDRHGLLVPYRLVPGRSQRAPAAAVGALTVTGAASSPRLLRSIPGAASWRLPCDPLRSRISVSNLVDDFWLHLFHDFGTMFSVSGARRRLFLLRLPCPELTEYFLPGARRSGLSHFTPLLPSPLSSSPRISSPFHDTTKRGIRQALRPPGLLRRRACFMRNWWSAMA